MDKVLSLIARWMIVLALMLAYWPFGRSAHASPTPIQWKKELYSAKLDYKGSSYLFTIGTVDRPSNERERSRFVAQIRTGKDTLAVCERVLSGEAPMDVNSMTLRCEGRLFGPLAATAKFYYSDALPKPRLLIRTAPHVQMELELTGT